MKVIKNIKVPTGNICIVEGEKGLLEFVSLGDYGKEKNIKSDFMGLDREINGVAHGDLLSLEEKWVITISTQYGCSMGCTFCDVPKVGPGVNATFNDLIRQVTTGINIHPEVAQTKRLNIHFARMGEPTFNFRVIDSALYLMGFLKEKEWGYHPVISTMMPTRNHDLLRFIERWLILKNTVFNGESGLQLSINTTDESLRYKMFRGNAMSLINISVLMNSIVDGMDLKGRKITLNFALTEASIDAELLRALFSPHYYLIKITPMHVTESSTRNNLSTIDGYNQYYPYKEIEKRLKAVGFDVIVFIPSKEEDESRITCGNAILSGDMFYNKGLIV